MEHLCRRYFLVFLTFFSISLTVKGYPHKQGIYGAGHYFTTSAKYSSPFFIKKDVPALIISYCIPGNPYPIIQQGMNFLTFSLNPSVSVSSYLLDLGNTSLKPGYQSHYVCTTQTGFPISELNSNTELFGEIIINQEEQVVPAYILILEPNQPFFEQLEKEIRLLPRPPSIPSPSSAPVKGTILSSF